MPIFDCATGQLLPDPPAPPLSLDQRKAAMQERVKAIRDQLEVAGADTPAGRVQTDLYSQGKILALVSEANIAIARGEPFAEGFGLEDNTIALLDAEQAVDMGRAVYNRIKALFAHSFALRLAIGAAADAAELDAIDVEAGWP